MNKKETQQQIDQIIQQNNNENNESENVDQKTNIDTLCKDILNEIGSYLNLFDYCHLNRINRSLFIQTTSPMPIQSLPIRYPHESSNIFDFDYDFIKSHLKGFMNDYISKTKIVDRNKFSRLQSLSLSNKWRLQQIEDNQLIFTNLQELQIGNCMISMLINSKCIDLNNITTLRFNPSQTTHLNILYHLPSLQNVKMRYFPENGLEFESKHANIISKLKGAALGFGCHHNGSGSNIFDLCGVQLQSLHIINTDINNEKLKKFTNLKELCITEEADEDDIDGMAIKLNEIDFKSLKSLKRIKLLGSMKVTGLKQLLLAPTIESIQFVHFICILDEEVWNKLITSTTKALLGAPTKTLRISMAIRRCQEDIAFGFESLINAMHTYLEHFMFVGYLYCGQRSENANDYNEWDKVQKWLNQLIALNKFNVTSNLHKIQESGHKRGYYTFSVANKGCRISGYRDKWDMTCSHCKDSGLHRDLVDL